MKWPWVSRADADRSFAAMERAVELAEGRTAALQARYDDLLKSHLAYLAPTKTTAHGAIPVPREPKPKSVIQTTIKNESQGDARLAAYLQKRARELRAEHPTMSDDGIALMLTQWESTEPTPTEES